jgi:hypothetical protein
LTLMSDNTDGKWPCRAPTKNNLDDAKMAPFSEPNVEQAGNIDDLKQKLGITRSIHGRSG